MGNLGGMFIGGGIDDEGNPFIDEGPHLKEVWGLFAKVAGKEQLFGWVNKKKTARKICERKNKRYSGRPFYYRAMFTTTDENERRITRYESQADLQAGLAEKVGNFLEGSGVTGPGASASVETIRDLINAQEETQRVLRRHSPFPDEADFADERVLKIARDRLDTGRTTGHSVPSEGSDTPADGGPEGGGEGPTAGDGISDTEATPDNS